MRKILVLLVFLTCAMVFVLPASAAEPAWWTQQKQDCGLAPNLAYNDWVAQGSPCNKSGGNSGAPAPSSGSELGTKLGSAIGDGILDLFKSNDQAAQQQRAQEAAQQAEIARQQAAEAKIQRKNFEASKADLLNGLRDNSEGGEEDKVDASVSTDGLGLRDVGNDDSDQQPTPTDKGWAQISLQNNTRYWMNLFVDYQSACGPVMPGGFCTHQVRPGSHYLVAIPRDEDVKYFKATHMKIKRGSSPTWTVQ